ncbi:hypothetical protein MNEG_15598, partial [Monoraphidium neglectum]
MPTQEVMSVLSALTSDPANEVWVVSGRARRELGTWFESLPDLGLAAEHGFYTRHPGAADWHVQQPHLDVAWQSMSLPILKQYQESTDGSWIEVKESSLVWHYRDADPDFGNWQAKELMDHLEDVLSNMPVEVSSGNTIVEIKPQGVSKGAVVESILERTAAAASASAASEASAAAAPEDGGSGGISGGGAGSAAAAAVAAAERAAAQRRVVRFAEAAAPEFVMCIGDDRSDEEMFVAIEEHGAARQK